MKILLCSVLSIISLFSLQAHAQRRFSISVTGAPAYSYTDFTGTVLIPGTNGQFVPTTLTSESAFFGVSVGAMASYRFSREWSLSTGLWYDRLTQTKPDPSPVSADAKIIMSSLKIPVLFNYKPFTTRLAPYFTVGGLINQAQPTRLINVLAPNTDESILFASSATYRAVLGAGVTYRINNHFSVIVQPMLLYRFRPNRTYERFVSYQLNGQTQLVYTF
ncbi:outer membrane beta-barrel protein [Spirosoma soli]|uniref:Outer membrane beta-barrel protein n=1 Tax=Spirosoma soli TaxID=1770529 RepID=A0ABW5LY82_9BACT